MEVLAKGTRRYDRYDRYRLIKYKYTDYKCCCKRKSRTIAFELSLEEFTGFFDQNCYYCDRDPYNITVNKGKSYVYEGKGMGIDRKVDSIGYTMSNCVPCCKECNMMKKSMNDKEYIKHCITVAAMWEV